MGPNVRTATPIVPPMTVRSLTEFCVYTIVDGRRLRRLAKEEQIEPFDEGKRWVTAQRLWLKAKGTGEGMPVVFADATECNRLVYWGLLTEVHLTDEGTRFEVDRLRKVAGTHSPQELVLRDSGKTIAPHFIKPYALCRTPRFLVT